MAIFRECKHSFQIVQALLEKVQALLFFRQRKGTISMLMGWYRLFQMAWQRTYADFFGLFIYNNRHAIAPCRAIS